MTTPEAVPAALPEFAGLAEQFCALIERRGELASDALLRAAHGLLPRLYVAALALPAVEADDGTADEPEAADDGGGEYEGAAAAVPGRPDRPSTKQWFALYRSLGALVGEGRNHYAEVFDPYAEPPEAPVTGSLADDLADVYADLADGLAKWRRGEHDEAAWEWRYQFTVHWGEHAVSALRALYALSSSHDLGFPGPRAAAA